MLLVILYLHIAQCYMSLCPKIVLGMFPVPRTLSAPCSRPRTSWSSFQNYSTHSTYSLLKRQWNWEISFLVTTIILYLHKVESCSSQCLKLVLGTFHYTFPPGRQTLSALCSRPRTSWSIVQNYPTQSMYSLLDGGNTIIHVNFFRLCTCWAIKII